MALWKSCLLRFLCQYSFTLCDSLDLAFGRVQCSQGKATATFRWLTRRCGIRGVCKLGPRGSWGQGGCACACAGAEQCRSYRGHLLHTEYMHHNAIPQSEALVLFHYMTRSFQDFRERKLSRYRTPLRPVDPATHTIHTSVRAPHSSPLNVCTSE